MYLNTQTLSQSFFNFGLNACKVIFDFFTRKFLKFSGRASRTEFFVILFFIFCLFEIVFCFLEATILLSPFRARLFVLFIFFITLPSFCLTIRRLHDFNFNGYWFFLFIFFVIAIELFTGSAFLENANLYLKQRLSSVSYTHLTLPTILLV